MVCTLVYWSSKQTHSVTLSYNQVLILNQHLLGQETRKRNEGQTVTAAIHMFHVAVHLSQSKSQSLHNHNTCGFAILCQFDVAGFGY